MKYFVVLGCCDYRDMSLIEACRKAIKQKSTPHEGEIEISSQKTQGFFVSKKLFDEIKGVLSRDEKNDYGLRLFEVDGDLVRQISITLVRPFFMKKKLKWRRAS